MEVMVEAEVFVEVAFGKVMDGLDYDRLALIVLFLWSIQRRALQISLAR